MNTEHANPYAPTLAALEAREGGACWREGKQLAVPTGGSLPARCVKCNAPAEMDRARVFTWHDPRVYLAAVALPVYVIIALIARKRAWIAIGLCEAHRKRRSVLNWSAAVLLALGVAAFLAAIALAMGGLGILAAGLLLVGIVTGVLAARTLSAAHISDTQARLRGCGEAFLDSLPARL